MSPLVQKREELAIKQSRFAAILTEAKTSDPTVFDFKQVKSLDGSESERAIEVKRLNAELNALGETVELLKAQEDSAKRNDYLTAPTGFVLPNGKSIDSVKSFAQMFTESDAYTKRTRGGLSPAVEMDIDVKAWVGSYGLKTTMTTAAGFAPQPIRSGDIVPIATRPVQLLDYIPAMDTSQNAVVYMEETTLTNNAAETGEGVAYPEAALAFTQRSSSVIKIPVFLPVTDEQLEDVPFIMSYVQDRLGFMVRQRLDLQVLMGDGTGSNLTGINSASNLQTQAKGADPAPDAIYKAIVKVFVTGRAVADTVVMHPTDWQGLRLLRSAEGIYLWGSPADSGAPRIWGLPIAQSDAGSAGSAYVGDVANYCYLAYRHGLDIQVGYINDDFKLGKKSIRADVRVAFVVRRGAAFCKVTGL